METIKALIEEIEKELEQEEIYNKAVRNTKERALRENKDFYRYYIEEKPVNKEKVKRLAMTVREMLIDLYRK
jgi:site-specific recombinase XerD